MKYKITIQTFEEIKDKAYPKIETIYEQKVDKLNVKGVIDVVNEKKECIEIVGGGGGGHPNTYEPVFFDWKGSF